METGKFFSACRLKKGMKLGNIGSTIFIKKRSFTHEIAGHP
jgi:hypothetical protein